MTWQDIAWEGCQTEVSESEIQRAEQALGVTFPEDYRSCVKKCHGGRPRNSNFSFEDPAVGHMESSLSVLLSLSPEDPENLVDTHRRLLPFLPAGVLPIADDGGGDFICLQYRAESQPSIVYWHHGAQSVVPLSETFAQFLETLYEGSPHFLPKTS